MDAKYKQCSAHYEHWFAGKQMQIHCNLLGVAAVNTLVDKEPSAKPLSHHYNLEEH